MVVAMINVRKCCILPMASSVRMRQIPRLRLRMRSNPGYYRAVGSGRLVRLLESRLRVQECQRNAESDGRGDDSGKIPKPLRNRVGVASDDQMLSICCFAACRRLYALHQVDDLAQVRACAGAFLLGPRRRDLATDISTLQGFPVQRAEKLSARSLVTAAGIPSLKHVHLGEGQISQKE